MPTDLIRYDLLVQDALKGVVRKVLSNAMREGIPGEHHFYLSFRTGDKGVRISPALREKYPDEMTIVLQHQFWDLSVTEHVVEVGLYFSNVPEKLVIPFEAVSGFFDPSVQFGLKFELSKDGTLAGSAKPMPAAAKEPGELTRLPSRQRTLEVSPPADAPKPARKGSEKAAKSAPDAKSVPETKPEAGAKSEAKPAADAKLKIAQETADDKSAEGHKVISLDAFRKKP
ncbi:hypothetical protein SAMN05444161_0970 [Rhizobiales bacterium GAS191]|jgi:hypothetical protein|nr:hypothetical protein SAMN05444161_0970 [Rhizobiales bacterium GAS191]